MELKEPKDLNLEVNITAYLKEGMVNSCIAQIRRVLPDVFIRVWDNSPSPLQISGASEIRTNKFNPSLSRIWNWSIGLASSDLILISNDDIRFTEDWYQLLALEVESHPNSLWFGPSRCFLVRPKLIDLVGWFDERMNGFTWEDYDMICRMNSARVEHLYGTRSTLNGCAKSLKQEIPDRQCHPFNNKEFIEDKYGSVHPERFDEIPRFSTPDFYPLRPK